MKKRLVYLSIFLALIGCQNDVGLNSLISLSTENPGVNVKTAEQKLKPELIRIRMRFWRVMK
jgi:hypothetical protein